MTPIFTSKTLTLTILGLSTLSFAGCSKNTEHAKPSPTMPEITLVKSETRNILRTVGQPGFVEAYEEPKCVGCNRCGRVCLAKINPPDLIRELQEENLQ